MIAAKASGKAVQRTTRMKISQTWLASQTGVRDCWTPPPAGPAGEEAQEAAAEVGAAEDRVEGRPDPEDRGACVRLAHRTPPPLGLKPPIWLGFRPLGPLIWGHTGPP